MDLFVKIRIYPEITLEMLQKVFETDKIDSKLQKIVDCLNEIKDGEPAYVKYHLDTEERLAHFFAQCYVEVNESKFKLEEDLDYSVQRLIEVYGTFKERRNTNNTGNRPHPNGLYPNFERAFKIGRLETKSKRFFKPNIGDEEIFIKEVIKELLDDDDENYKKPSNERKSYILEIDLTRILMIIEGKDQVESNSRRGEAVKNKLYEQQDIVMDNGKENIKTKNYSQEEKNEAMRILSAVKEILRQRGNPTSNLLAQGDAIADIAYANKLGNGNSNTKDGSNFKGRGMIHLTGKDHYRDFEKWLYAKGLLQEEDCLISNPKLLEGTLRDYFFLSAVYFWNAKSIYLKARKPEPNESGDSIVDSVTDIVNKNTDSRDKRIRAYKRIKGNRNLENSIFKDFRK